MGCLAKIEEILQGKMNREKSGIWIYPIPIVP